MLIAPIALSPAPDLRVSGLVTDRDGRPLSRRVLLFDAASLAGIAETRSDARGRAEFTVSGRNGNDRFIVLAVGGPGESNDVSCKLHGAPVQQEGGT